jgi:hydrogenase-4 component F
MRLLLLSAPLALGALALLLRRRWANRVALLGTAALFLGSAIAWAAGADGGGARGWLSEYLAIDAAGLYFLVIMALVLAGASVYGLSYFRERALTPRQEAVYAAEMAVFVVAMTGVILARHLALLWVFVEATTLSSALLIYFERRKSSLEAAWKYIFICSVGIALAFVGIILLSIGSQSIGSLFFSDLGRRAGEINPFWLKMAFSFILVGFGTKIGVAPLHAWLPDAHSEAPSPVSALLSGALLNSTFLGLLRVHEIMVQAGLQDFSRILLFVTGFLSLLISAAFLLQTANYKRMLAYSSIENMGLLFLGTALGPPGLYAALLHSAAHSLSKASLFLTSGNILALTASKKIEDVRGLLRREPLTGWIWIVSFLAVAGFPLFPTFLSKFLLIRAFFQAGLGWLVAPLLLLVVVIVFGMGGAVFRMSFGDPPEHAPDARLGVSALAPQIVLLALLLSIGVSIPAVVQALIQAAAGFIP